MIENVEITFNFNSTLEDSCIESSPDIENTSTLFAFDFLLLESIPDISKKHKSKINRTTSIFYFSSL